MCSLTVRVTPAVTGDPAPNAESGFKTAAAPPGVELQPGNREALQVGGAHGHTALCLYRPVHPKWLKWHIFIMYILPQ